MERFKNILVVLNDVIGDDDTLTLAANLARKNNAYLTVLEVVQDSTLSSSFLDERKKRLDRLTESIRVSGVKVETTLLKGTLFLEVIHQVLRRKHDLVLMVTDGGRGYRKLFFGSDTLHLLRKCPCPVWVTKQEPQSSYDHILAAIGPLSEDDKENSLNTSIMDLATSIARQNEGILHVVHSWEVTGDDSLTLRSEITAEIENNILTKHKATFQNSLDHFLGHYDLSEIAHEIHLKRGAPEFLVPEVQDTSDINLIVMGAIKKSVFPGYFVGNSAESILEQVNCSVLAVKPEGFVSPVVLEERFY
jgi:universal stress protein E